VPPGRATELINKVIQKPLQIGRFLVVKPWFFAHFVGSADRPLDHGLPGI